ncbi:PTS transporter subunit EIIB [uncultured Thomasclavelia sp.]|uniref:PTS transporter subunit EIIB n=1 Tax=uncultured Thomasclavelia sp. TaxID=3025759 RepID=UPI0025F508D1|nr:PTS transporter subunit EIIB [uncultured Thomasclavelia sp.]
MNYLPYILIAIVIIAILAYIFIKSMKNKGPKPVSASDIPVDVNEIIKAVGGKDNLKETTATSSKVTFFVNDDTLVDIEALKALGASGIVQTSNKITAILGKYSKEISRMINDQ